MKRELVCVSHHAKKVAAVGWMDPREVSKLRRRIEAERLPLVVSGPNGFTDTNVHYTAAEMISQLIYRRRAH
jgi:hypothetical protein